jgi:DNA-binding transcriptional LysR family regulator
MEIRHLTYFLVLAQELNFSKAAQKLHITQPPLSRAIQQLEAELQAKLFERNNRSVVLTPAGAFLLSKAQKQVDDFYHLKPVMQAFLKGYIGELRLGYIGSAMQNFLPANLSDYRKNYPDVKLSLHEMPSQKQLEALEKHEIDVALIREMIYLDAYRCEKAFEEPFILAVPGDSEIPAPNERTFGSLKQASFVLFPRRLGSELFDKIIGLCQENGFSPNIIHEANHMHSIIKMVEAGFGLSIVPASVQFNIKSNVKFYPLDFSSAKTIISVVYHSKENRAAVKNFIATLGI